MQTFPKRTIIHLDMDSFFAAVEQQANPFLRGLPVGIIKQEGRTCVIAASLEAKKRGVKTGVSVWEARRLCPQIVLVPADLGKYFDVTKRFAAIGARFTPLVEVFSIDEIFLDVTASQKLFGGPFFTVLQIKRALAEEVGDWITCSAGVAENKLLAKLASDQGKPDGYFEISAANRDEVLRRVGLADVCGIGWRLERRLRDAGITNLLQIRNLSDGDLGAAFGPFWSEELRKISLGIDESPVVASSEIPQMKSVSRTFTLFADTRDERVIRQTVRNLCEEAAFKARRMGLAGRQVGLVIRGGGESACARRTLKSYLDDGREVFGQVWRLWEGLSWPYAVRFAGVWLGRLEHGGFLSEDLFPWRRKRRRVLKTVDRVNERYGDFTLYPATLLGGELIRPEVNGFLGDKKWRL